MDRTSAADGGALRDPKSFYDARFTAGYMQGFDDVYERCRLITLRHTLRSMAGRLGSGRAALDYGCGEGRYLPLLAEHLPGARLYGCDISAKALDSARRHHPDATFVVTGDERIELPDASMDFVLSVEVLEHVANVELAVAEIGRVLRPGGMCVVTTPCANPWSLEWFMNRSRGLQPSHDGYGRFATDEPAHLRRLKSSDLRRLMDHAGVDTRRVRYRAHLFTELVHTLPRVRDWPVATRARLAMLDWWLFRVLPNGATMLAVGSKRG